MSTLILPYPSTHPDLCHGKYVAGLFAKGEQGAWFDPSDLSTLYQDAAGTTPVTAVGQPVGKILDKSGRGNHATQDTTTRRPTLKQDASGKYYLSFDGVDDYLSTGSINFTATDKMTVVAGVRKLTDTASGVFVELSADSPTRAGAFVLLSPSSSGANSYRFFSRGSIAPASSPGNGVFAAAPDTSTITCISNISGPEQTLRRNAGLVESSTASQGTGNYGNYPLYIGRRGGTSLPFNGNLYGLIVRGAQTDDAHLTHAEKYLAYKSGVTL